MEPDLSGFGTLLQLHTTTFKKPLYLSFASIYLQGRIRLDFQLIFKIKICFSQEDFEIVYYLKNFVV